MAVACMWFPPRARPHPADPGMSLKQKFTGWSWQPERVDIDGDVHRGHGWEHEKFCIKTSFKSLDDPGIVTSKGPGEII